MNEEVKQKVAKLLNEASKLLVNSGLQPTTSGTSPSVRNDDSPSGSSSASSPSPLGETLHRAQNMPVLPPGSLEARPSEAGGLGGGLEPPQ